MTQLPADLAQHYRAGKDIDVRALSYGLVNAVRVAGATAWDQTCGTLDDQRIFGTLRSLECACGKFRGVEHRGLVCDRCGVKVASPEIRRTRFGHVELESDITHPFDMEGRLSVWPVLPAEFARSAGAGPLLDRYEDLVRAVHSGESLPLKSAVWKICDLLLPVVEAAWRWRMSDADTLARGLALVPIAEGAADDERCRSCGYPLRWLSARFCPGCGGAIDEE